MYYTGSYYVKPRQEMQFPIGYTPTNNTPATEYLNITSNDPNHATASIQINGGGGVSASRTNHARIHRAQ
jgi:hypothetical protein